MQLKDIHSQIAQLLSTQRLNRSQRQPLRLPLRGVLVIPFLLQLTAAVGLTGYFSLRNGQQAVNRLAEQLLSATKQLVNQHLDSYLELPQKANQINANLIQQGVLDLNDLETIGQHFWKQIQIYPTLSYIGLTLPTGEYIGAGDWLEAPGIEVDQIAADGQAETYAVDSNGNRQKLIDRYEYFPRKEDWYIDILQLGKPNWTVAAEVSQPDEHAPFYVAANANWPIYDSSGKLLALISTDLEISHISQFLASLRPSASSRIFIIQRDGSLVGSCSLPRLSEASDFEKAMQANGRIDVLNLPVSLTQATAQYLHQTFGGFQTIQHSQTLNFNFQGDRQYVQVTPWQDDFGLDWLVVVVVPESDFMAQIHANTRTTILLCIVSAAIASLLGLFTAYWIARPISRLNRAAKAIAAGNLEQQVESSPIQELSSLSQSFNRMATQLTNSFNDLESTNETLEHRVRQRTQDLTQALRDLQQTQIQLVQTEKMSSLGQLVAGVAHEINNPISFIYGNLPHAKGYIHDLLKILQCYQQEYSTPSTSLKNLIEEVELAFLQEDLPKLLSSMQVGAERIQGIVQSLRTFSRLDESGFKPVDIHEGIDSTLMILQSRLKATSKRPAIKVIKEYDTLPLVSCYPGQLNQVFMNILANATDALDELEKHCPAVDASMYKIRICTKKAEPNGVIIRIANWGKKIPEEVYSQLFDPFFTTKPIGKGTGLGLSISHQITVENHKGKLWCNRNFERGAEFVIEIPIAR